MRYNEIINELFNQVANWKVVQDGSEYVVEFTIGETPFTVDIVYADTDKNDNEVYEVVFDADGEYALTGKGSAFQVMATVIDVIKSWVGKKHPASFYFTATKKEPSRVELYSRIAKTLVRGSNYTLEAKDVIYMNDPAVVYRFTRK